jgi:uncharacterized protein
VTDTDIAITCEADLDAAVGPRPAGWNLKAISFLDAHCGAMLACSSFLVLGTGGRDGLPRTVALGAAGGPGTIVSPGRLGLPPLGLSGMVDGAPAGVLVLVPGYGETLRINGTLRLGDEPGVDVHEAYLHCAKAIIRSRLWDEPIAADGVATPADPPVGWDADAAAFLARSPFVTVASIDGDGHADVSPKGDPPGFVRVLDDGRLALPDRPGNGRTDTMHNLLSRPVLGLLAFVPGESAVLEVAGRTELTADPAVLESMAVNGRTPKAAIVIDVERTELRSEPGIDAAGLWDPSHRIEEGTLPRAIRIWTDHVKLNEDPGPEAEAMRAMVNEPALAQGIEHDYENNLY